MNDPDRDHIRYLEWRLKQANKTMGKQGRTIAALRGELARTREENSKIYRHELRRLERFENDALTAIQKLDTEIVSLREENARLRERLATSVGLVPTTEEGSK